MVFLISSYLAKIKSLIDIIFLEFFYVYGNNYFSMACCIVERTDSLLPLVFHKIRPLPDIIATCDSSGYMLPLPDINLILAQSTLQQCHGERISIDWPKMTSHPVFMSKKGGPATSFYTSLYQATAHAL